MLLDEEMRAPLEAGLAIQETAARTERLLLRLAVGARDRAPVAVVSADRHRRNRARACRRSTRSTSCARSPDASRSHEELQERAVVRGRAQCSRGRRRRDPADAIDDLEHDLAVLRRSLLADESAGVVRGHAHYLLRLNDCAEAIGDDALGARARRSGRRSTASRASPG